MCNYLWVLPLMHFLIHAQTTSCSAREIVGKDHGDHDDHDDLGPDWQSVNLPGWVVVEAPFRHLNTAFTAQKHLKTSKALKNTKKK